MVCSAAFPLLLFHTVKAADERTSGEADRNVKRKREINSSEGPGAAKSKPRMSWLSDSQLSHCSAPKSIFSRTVLFS